MPSYSRWKHRITYSLSPVTSATNRWVTLVLPWRVGIKVDYSDIRFSDTAGRALSYNIASKTDRVTATIKILIPVAGVRLIHCYFGNGQAVSESTSAETEDTNPVLKSISGTNNPAYNNTRVIGGWLNQQGYSSVKNGRGPYPQWKQKALFGITNPVSTSNYQHKLSISWKPGMRSDFRDIRFAQTNGKKCDYWIESYTYRTSAVVWIEVPTANQRYLNLYYGNGRAVSESNGTNTFDFFDDFESGSLSPTKWPTGYSNYSVSTSGAYSGYSASRSGSQALLSTGTIESLSSHIIEFKVKFTENNKYHFPVFCDKYLLVAHANGTWAQYTGSAYNYYSSYLANTWYSIKLVLNKSINTYSIYIDNSLIATVTNNSGFNAAAPTNFSVYNVDGGQSAGIYLDDVRIRKYAATEPTLTLLSHQPNSSRITPYETLGTQPTGGQTYVMDPIEFGICVSGEMGATILQPVVEFGHTIAVSAPVTVLQPLVEFGYTIAGSVISRNYIPLDQLDLTQINVSKSVTDDIWAMNATIDGYQSLNTDILIHATFATTDHLGVSQNIFAGILPKSAHTIKEAANKTTITGYDYAWYLARQKVPTGYQHNTAGTNPAVIIRGLLGGDDWEETTGIMPFNILDVAGWGSTLNSRVFDFAIGTTKKAAIEKICAYCRCIFLVKWIVVEGIATPAGYFISEDDIDTELDLPTPVTFAYPDDYLIDDIKPVVKGDERYNRVTVIGRDNAGGVFTWTVESAAVSAGEELPVEYIENSGSWTTQAQVTARCVELFAYYSTVASTYSATLIDRMDIELLQKIKITGYTAVSENWMRITKIKKTVRATNDGVQKIVDIEFTENLKWSALKRMYRYSDDLSSGDDSTVNSVIKQMPGNQLGVITALDGQECDVALDSGQTISARGV